MDIHVLIGGKMKKIISAILLLSVFLSLLCGCADKKEPYVIACGEFGITEKQYDYWLAYYKTKFLNTFLQSGTVTESDYTEDFWDTEISERSLYELTKEQAESYISDIVICLALYDEYKLGEIEGAEEQIEISIDQFIDEDIKSAGSRSALNKHLSEYKLNIKQLREIYEFEIKRTMVEDYLYGELGTDKVTDEDRDNYYRENYVRVKHVLVNTKDKYVLDDKGERIMDPSTGYYKTEKLTNEEIATKTTLAAEIFEKAQSGEDFEKLIEKYGEDEGMTYYTDGYFLTKSSPYEENFLNASFDMKDGEIKSVTSAYGIHIMKKYALEDGGYKKEVNENFFAELDSEIISQKKKNKFSEKSVNITAVCEADDFKAYVIMDDSLL